MRPDGCPSEAVLDRYELGELEQDELRQHIEGCPNCRERLADRRLVFDRMPERSEMVRTVHVTVVEARAGGDRRRWRRPALAASALGLFGFVLAVWPADGVRSKGRVSLSVYLERTGRVERASSGQRFRPGDRLRFEVDLPAAAEVLILGREASGELYAAFPVGDGVVRSQPLPRGADQVLPGAVELDGSTGHETLYLVGCPAPFDSSEVEVEKDRLVPPPGCTLGRFVLEKVPQ